MTEEEIRAIKSLIAEREEITYQHLKGNKQYQDICNRQKEVRKTIEELYSNRFTKEEQSAIENYYEGENEKRSIEIDEVYSHGLKDCFKLVIYLGISPSSIKL